MRGKYSVKEGKIFWQGGKGILAGKEKIFWQGGKDILALREKYSGKEGKIFWQGGKGLNWIQLQRKGRSSPASDTKRTTHTVNIYINSYCDCDRFLFILQCYQFWRTCRLLIKEMFGCCCCVSTNLWDVSQNSVGKWRATLMRENLAVLQLPARVR